MPFALMLAVISTVIGLIAGLIMAGVFGAIIASIPTTGVPTTGTNTTFAPLLSVLFGFGAVIMMPIAGFIGGLIQGLIIAVLYNLLAPRIGGIRLRFKEDSTVPQAQA